MKLKSLFILVAALTSTIASHQLAQAGPNGLPVSNVYFSCYSSDMLFYASGTGTITSGYETRDGYRRMDFRASMTTTQSRVVNGLYQQVASRSSTVGGTITTQAHYPSGWTLRVSGMDSLDDAGYRRGSANFFGQSMAADCSAYAY